MGWLPWTIIASLVAAVVVLNYRNAVLRHQANELAKLLAKQSAAPPKRTARPPRSEQPTDEFAATTAARVKNRRSK